MKICHTKALKIIKELEAQKDALLEAEIDESIVAYTETEKKIAPTYDYTTTRAQVKAIDDKVRRIRVNLAQANTKVIINDFKITISEALVLLAQLECEKNHLTELTANQQLTRRITSNGVVEYKKCLYNVATVKQAVEKLREQISDLQIAIDHANLTNMIEI